MKFKYLLGPAGFLINNKKVQRVQEDIANKINPNLGRIVEKSNTISNDIEKVADRIAVTAANAIDSNMPQINIYRAYFAPEVRELFIGDHLYVQRFQYTHHGVYIGNGQVAHYLLERVKVDSLEAFADGSKILKRSKLISPIKFDSDEVVQRALSRLNESEYNLIINNCEHFVRWCRNGD